MRVVVDTNVFVGACIGRGEGAVFRGLRPPANPELFLAAYGLPVEPAVACPPGARRPG